MDKGISNYFTKGPVTAQPKAKVWFACSPLRDVTNLSQPVKTKDDDNFLANLLFEVDDNIPRPKHQPTKANRSQDKRKTRLLSPSAAERKPQAKRLKTIHERGPSTPPADQDPIDMGNDQDFMMGLDNDDDDEIISDPLPSSPIAKAGRGKAQGVVKLEEEEEDDLMEVAQATGVATASVNMSGKRPAPKTKKVEAYPSPVSSSPTKPPTQEVDASAWTQLTEKLNVLNSSQSTESTNFGKLDHTNAIEEDGSLRMFWTDYTEVNGTLCLFGKVQNKQNGSFVSCFIKVDNILRTLYFLPRQQRQKNGTDSDEGVEMKDVYEEVDELMGKMNVGLHKIKPCTRKYAFELPNVPKESDYLKLRYPYSSMSLVSWV